MRVYRTSRGLVLNRREVRIAGQSNPVYEGASCGEATLCYVLLCKQAKLLHVRSNIMLLDNGNVVERFSRL